VRLRRLHLAPYGRFAEGVLDFGDARAGSDVTVIYGPNEAGKSTTFAAWLDLLFGIPGQTPYSFRHPRSTLRIGAQVETGEGAITLWRTGKRQDSLTDGDGRAVPQHRLDALLHGLGREAYRSRFSLDDSVLREGGEEILAAKGDLGEVLYAGTSGLSGLSAGLADIAAGIDEVHRKGASTTVLAKGRKELVALDEALKEARLDPRRNDALRAATEAADGALERAEAELSEARGAVALNAAAGKRAELRADLGRLTDRLAAMPEGPDLPAGAETRMAELRMTVQQGGAVLTKARAAQDAATGVLEAGAPDPEGLRIGEEGAALDAMRFHDDAPLVSRADTDGRDLPRRETALAQAETELAALIAEIAPGGADPRAMALPDDVIEGLEGAVRAWRDARLDRLNALDEAQSAREALGEAVPAPDDPETLKAARRIWHDARRADAPGLREAARDAEAAALRAAAGLPQDWRALAGAAAGLPDEETVLAALRAIDARDAAAATAAQALAEAQEALDGARVARDALAGRDDHVSDAALVEARRARDAAWAIHRAALDDGTADDFEGMLRADDAARRTHADGTTVRERVRQAAGAIAEAEGRVVRRQAALDTARSEVLDSRARAAPLTAALGLTADEIPAMRPRLLTLREALRAALEAEEAGRKADAAQAALDEAKARLRGVLGPQATDDPELLDAAAQAREGALETARLAHDAWRNALAQAEKRDEALALKDTALERAGEAVRVLVAGSPFAGQDAEGVETRLPALKTIALRAGEVASLRQRVSRMRDACEAFEAAAKPLRALLGSEETPVALVALATRRGAEAIATRDRIEAARGALDTAIADAADAQAEIDAAEAERAALLDGQDIGEGDPDALLARLLERDGLRAQGAELSERIDRAASGHDPAALAEEEGALDPGRAALLADRVTEAERARDEAVSARALARKAEDDARAGQGGGAIDQQRAALLDELREATRAAAARMIGLRAARAALDRLRRARRGPMLDETQAAFIRMTGGEWTALETRPDGTGERLVARRGEETVAAEGMSQGTRGQLYLSLRLAGYGLFCGEYGPLPFVTDDVLETFDDARAAAALDLTAELGKRGQAIFLTHHRHLADMAQQRIPGVRILDLEDAG